MAELTPPAKIVFAEDDSVLAELIQTFFAREGLEVVLVNDGDEVLDTVARVKPNLILLDIMLPHTDGLSLCQSLREQKETARTPIILFTANDSDIKHILGLDLGANDYIVKTTPPNVLLARVKSQLRQHAATIGEPIINQTHPPKQVIELGRLYIDSRARAVRLANEPIYLSGMEFELLWLLACNAGQVLSRRQILLSLRSATYDGADRSIDIAVSRLRKKLHDDAIESARIVTVRNKGYLLSPSAWD